MKDQDYCFFVIITLLQNQKISGIIFGQAHLTLWYCVFVNGRYHLLDDLCAWLMIKLEPISTKLIRTFKKGQVLHYRSNYKGELAKRMANFVEIFLCTSFANFKLFKEQNFEKFKNLDNPGKKPKVVQSLKL